MTFDKYPGYPLNFIQRQICKDGSPHLFTDVFKFYSPLTGYKYIIRAEYHREQVFALKFYVQQHSKSDFKYQKITNKGDVGNILISCLKVIPYLLKKMPDSSFAFIASPSIDSATKRIEPQPLNQRFQTYSYLIHKKIGQQTFEHITYPGISAYLLLNKRRENLHKAEDSIKSMFIYTYPRLTEII